jgi:hypothetical protein
MIAPSTAEMRRARGKNEVRSDHSTLPIGTLRSSIGSLGASAGFSITRTMT